MQTLCGTTVGDILQLHAFSPCRFMLQTKKINKLSWELKGSRLEEGRAMEEEENERREFRKGTGNSGDSIVGGYSGN